MTRAKFYVTSVTKSKMGQDSAIGTVVEMAPVINGSEENETFYRYTPSGSIKLGTLNDAAAAEFEIGKEIYVDFSAA